MALTRPISEASTGRSSSPDPTSRAAAASPPAASSALPGRPVRRSEATTSWVPVEASAASNAATDERTEPVRSKAGTERASRAAAWIAVALVRS